MNNTIKNQTPQLLDESGASANPQAAGCQCAILNIDLFVWTMSMSVQRPGTGLDW